jgi:hypothetical protein
MQPLLIFLFKMILPKKSAIKVHILKYISRGITTTIVAMSIIPILMYRTLIFR